VARTIQRRGVGTLLFDLLTPGEEQLDLRTRYLRFDIDLLTERVVATLDWLAANPETRGLGIGLFGSSTGAAAALRAAARRPERTGAVVSRGGRVDLAGEALAQVKAPTLFIVGGADDLVLELNRAALEDLQSTKKLSVVPGATHLFEEPGALEMVARLAAEWFERFIGAPVGRLPWEGKETEPWPPG